MSLYDQLLKTNSLSHDQGLVLLTYASKNKQAIRKDSLNTWLKQIDWEALDIYAIHETVMRVCLLCKTMKYEDGQIKSPFTDIYNVARSPTFKRFNTLLENKAFLHSPNNFKLGVLSVLNTADNFWERVSPIDGIEYDISKLAQQISIPNLNLSFFKSIYEGPEIFESMRLACIDLADNDITYELPESLIQCR